jgi:regulator of nucleoside diphosphate kinase
MTNESVSITEVDVLRLADILEAESRWPSADRRTVRALRSKLARAAVVTEHRVPADMITSESRVRVKDVETGRHATWLLVVPAQSSAVAGRISVLSSLGAALLGRREGDEIDYWVPGGWRRSRVERVLFQPEAQRRPLPHNSHDRESVGEPREPGGRLALTRVA